MGVCVCVCLCGLLTEGRVPSVISAAEWYSVPVDLNQKHLRTHQWFKTSEISKKTGACCFLFFLPFLILVFLFNFSLLFPAVISLPPLSNVSDKANTPRLARREIVTLPDFDQSHPNGELILI